MPLNSSNFVLNGHAASADLMQFVNLLTGVMTDQPVTITNTLTATTFVGNGAVPSGGASGQVLSKGNATSYNLNWTTPFTQANADSRYLPLTGGTLSGPLMFTADATNDIGTAGATRPRNLYVAQTVVVGSGSILTLGASGSGGFVTTALSGSLILGANSQGRWSVDYTTGSFLAQTDNAWDIGAVGANRPRSVYAATSFIGPGAVPTGGAAGQALAKVNATDYNVGWISVMTQTQADARYLPLTGGTLAGPGNLLVSGTLSIGSANERIRNPPNSLANLSVESADGNLILGGAGSAQVVYNGYWDGTNWQRFNTANTYVAWWVGPGFVQMFTAPAGANPVGTMTNVFSVSSAGNGIFAGTLSVSSTIYASTSIQFNNGATIAQYTGGSDVRVSISAVTVSPGPSAFAVTAINGALTINADTHVAGHGFYLDSPGSVLYLGNQTIQFVQTMYGLNNTCYITNDGTRWTTSGGFSISTDLAVTTTYSQGGITMNLNSGAANPYAIISTGGGDLYIRSNTGNVRMDSGSIWAPSCVISTLYVNSSAAAPYIQNAGAALRYYASGVHSFEGSGQVNCTIVQFTSSANCNGAVWRSDGVQNIVTLAPGGSQHWFMTNGQAGWATVYGLNFANQSARRSKDNICILEDPLSIVLNEGIHGVRYTERSTGDAKVGFIADDWLGVLPEIVGLDDQGDVAMLDYDRIGAVTFEALKQYAIQTNARIKALEAKLAA